MEVRNHRFKRRAIDSVRHCLARTRSCSRIGPDDADLPTHAHAAARHPHVLTARRRSLINDDSAPSPVLSCQRPTCSRLRTRAAAACILLMYSAIHVYGMLINRRWTNFDNSHPMGRHNSARAKWRFAASEVLRFLFVISFDGWVVLGLVFEETELLLG